MIKVFYHKTERKTTRSNKNPDPNIWSEEMPENWGETQAEETVALESITVGATQTEDDNSGLEEIPTNQPQKDISATGTTTTQSDSQETKVTETKA